MQNRRLMVYLILLLLILMGMIAFIVFRTGEIKKMGMEDTAELQTKGPDPANGGSIYLEGNDLDRKMIPISGGPQWLLNEGGGCAVCHGDNGRGGKPVRDLTIVPPDLTKAVGKSIGGMEIDEFVRLVKWGERVDGTVLSHEMPRFDLTKKAAEDLFAYIKEL